MKKDLFNKKILYTDVKLGKIPFNRGFTIKKFLNFVLIYSQMKIFKNSRVYGKPYRLIIDPVNICNLKCSLCPTGANSPGRKKCSMKFEEFKKIIDEMGDYLYSIDLYNWGEPFLNKDIFKMIRYARRKNIIVHISSNLNIFDEKNAEKLVDSRLDYLVVSLDGGSQETYEQYRIGGNFDQVIKNIKLVVQKKKEKKSKFPVICWQLLVMKQNEGELEKVKKMAKEIGVDILDFKPIRADLGHEVLKSDKEKYDSAKEFLPEDEKLSRFDYNKKKRSNKVTNCLYLWSSMTINPDGGVSPCCSTYEDVFDFGNILTDGFKKVWNNENYVESRKLIAKGKEPKVKTVCYSCYKNGIVDN
ncbi:radical SAM protein [archaeon]|jgi:radical SAM protein with 4Fe4S-binding SPASM domain|nr:radical SAM protein [archaeon]MBT4396848.1 radical SAM protein [archaeon]MBT4441474.1 radical SAM protein [archaeon]